jgi:glycogen(starch) synthase
MNIIIFPSSYLPLLGGVQEVAFRLSQELRKKGHIVKIITQRYPRSLKSKEVLEGIPVYRFIFPSPIPVIYGFKTGLKYLLGLFLAPVSFIRLLLLLNREKPDLVFLHFVGIFSLYLLVCKSILGFKLIVTFHGDDIEGLPRKYHFHRWVLGKTCSAAEYVTACSNYLIERAKVICPEIKGKSKAIHNGIDIDSYKEIEPYESIRPYIFSAGRFLHIKGIDVLINAFCLLVSKGYKVDLILAGEGTEQSKYEELAGKAGLNWVERGQENNESGSKILYWGKADREEMKKLLAGSEMTVVPSRVETFGLIVLEALAAGTPVIASNVGGIPEILQDGVGLIVAPNDETALADAMEKLLNDSDLRVDLIKNGLNRTLDFSWDLIAEKYLNLANHM